MYFTLENKLTITDKF